MKAESLAVVLAAGKGTRMNSDLPKVCHRCFGEPMITHVERSLNRSGWDRISVVVGTGREKVKSLLKPETETAVQQEQLGTGDALQAALAGRKLPADLPVLVTCGDVPGVRPETYSQMLSGFDANEADLSLLTTRVQDPSGYGRVVRDEAGVQKIVEAEDASPAEKEIDLVNTGIMCARAGTFSELLPELSADNAAGEYYLTDLVEFLTDRGRKVAALEVDSSWEVKGLNTRRQLVEFEREGYRRRVDSCLDNGVTVHDPRRTKIGPWVRLDRDVELENEVTLLGVTEVGRGSRFVGSTSAFHASFGEDNYVRRSHVTRAKFGDRVRIGPYCHVRPGTETGSDVRLGNFVEAKQARVEDDSNVSHLSYVGNAEVGEGANLGAGTITCNYDGYEKHRTVIGDEVFIGSNAELVAPVEIGTGAMVGAGSTITEDVPPDSLGVGRSKQEIKENWVKEEWKPRKEKETEEQ